MTEPEGEINFDADDLRSAQPLDVLCGPRRDPKGVLGKSSGEPIVLHGAPGTLSVPWIHVLTGVAIIAGSFYLLHQERFWAVLPLLVGFVFLYIGVDRVKSFDRRVRLVRPYQRGFVYELGTQSIILAHGDIELAALSERTLHVRSTPVGVFHDLVLSFEQKVYALSSFEPEGVTPRETDRFVLWARGVVGSVERRRQST